MTYSARFAKPSAEPPTITLNLRVFIHARWHRAGGEPLPEGAAERLGPYVTRYAQTLGCVVTAVGGADDHLHILFELPAARTLNALNSELMRATTRFVRESPAGPGLFAWDTSVDMESVSPEDVASIAAYVRENADRHMAGDLIGEYEGYPDSESVADDETPDWLRDAMEFRRGDGA